MYAASDATGIRRLALTGAATLGGDRACDYTRPVPCSNATGAFTTQLGDGVHALTVTASDAAGNPAPVTQTVRLDGTPPTARIAVARGRTILVDVGDNVSGVKSRQDRRPRQHQGGVPRAADHAERRPAAGADGPRARRSAPTSA